MGAVVALDTLFNGGQVWKGRPAPPAVSPQPTGHAALDAALPSGGWPEAALTEILLAGQGVGELQLVWPALARLSAAGERIVLIAPPYVPYPQAWQNAGVDLRQLSIIQASERDALWAAEQCLRSGSCGAVLCWPHKADDRRCGACRWRRKPARPWRLPIARWPKRSTLRRRPCALPSTPSLRSCGS